MGGNGLVQLSYLLQHEPKAVQWVRLAVPVAGFPEDRGGVLVRGYRFIKSSRLLQRGTARCGRGAELADVGVSAVYYGWSFADALERYLSGETVAASGIGLTQIFTKQNVSA